jgi:hypothetical protein
VSGTAQIGDQKIYTKVKPKVLNKGKKQSQAEPRQVKSCKSLNLK